MINTGMLSYEVKIISVGWSSSGEKCGYLVSAVYVYDSVTWKWATQRCIKIGKRQNFKISKWKQATYGWEQTAGRPTGNDIKNFFHIKEIDRNVTWITVYLQTCLHISPTSTLPQSDCVLSKVHYHLVSIWGQNILAQVPSLIPLKSVTLIFGFAP
jgi:hypothetical protein